MVVVGCVGGAKSTGAKEEQEKKRETGENKGGLSQFQPR